MRRYALYPRLPEGATVSDENYFNLESAGTTLERWRVWKKGFDSAHSDDTVSEEVRHVAARAFALMDTLDKTMF
jgi:hypothetical protein